MNPVRSVAIIGSGFAGSILARALQSRGVQAVLIERATHPRFALGESSTPLASISLERIARTYDLPDLLALATYGRWERELPGVGHGLKRGFTFYSHEAGKPYANSEANDRRLLVAASPDEEIADSHWLRADVDAHLFERARAAGALALEGSEVRAIERDGDGWRLRAGDVDVQADVIVNATGGPLLELEAAGQRSSPGHSAPVPLDTGLIYGHFADVGSFEACSDAAFPPGPYPDGVAAVHHLLDEGWMYVLPFDDGRVSAGIVIDRTAGNGPSLLSAPADAAWATVMRRYPTLEQQFADAREVRSLETIPRLQKRATVASGPGWAALPHAFAFTSPMFSTGIAWSLVAVERLAAALTGPPGQIEFEFSVYDAWLGREADHIDALVTPAYRLRRDFDAFAAWTYVYFAAASFHEAWQRLVDEPAGGWHCQGFLGAGDPGIRRLMGAVERALEGRSSTDPDPIGVVRESIRARNLAGLADPARERAYPVDLEALVSGAGLLDLSLEEARARLPRLRGAAEAATT